MVMCVDVVSDQPTDRTSSTQSWINRWAVPIYVAFTNAVCSHSIRSSFWLFVTFVLLLLSWTRLPIVSLVAQFSFCLFVSPTSMQRVSICAGPFLPHGLPISTWHCEPVTMPFVFVLCLTSVAPYNLTVFCFPPSAHKFGAAPFPCPWATMFGRRIIRRIPGRLSLSAVFGICRPV
jgi:hypothetical protein